MARGSVWDSLSLTSLASKKPLSTEPRVLVRNGIVVNSPEMPVRVTRHLWRLVEKSFVSRPDLSVAYWLGVSVIYASAPVLSS